MASSKSMSLLAATASIVWGAMTGPFPETTCLNSPGCTAETCTFIGKQPDPESCAALCLTNSNCTAYTWSDDSVVGYEDDCIFRVDGAWQPQNTGKPGWWSGECAGASSLRSSKQTANLSRRPEDPATAIMVHH